MEEFKREGALIIVEGVDGSGKSTQMELVGKWLESNGFSIAYTDWKSSRELKPLFKKMWRNDIYINPYVFSLLHAADFYQRGKKIIIPALKIGQIVLCDRYYYTPLVRDVARGMNPEWVKELYKNAPAPDLAFYFDVPPEIALQRAGAKPKYYESGTDLGLGDDRRENFKLFETKQIELYRAIAADKSNNLTRIDGTGPIPLVSPKTRELVKEFFKKKYKVAF